MTGVGDADLQHIVRAAIALDGVESAAVFVVRPGSPGLELGAAAGLEGPALDGLVAAVQNPGHPINRTAVDRLVAFDMQPMAPGGPPLRSHLPLVAKDEGPPTVLGVLAIAHHHELDAGARRELEVLAENAAATVATTDGPAID
jgi:hypothetical protein